MTDLPEDVVWPEATERLLHDPAFGPLVREVGPVRLRPSEPTPFEALVRSIVFQQLAGAAARTIHGRFVEVLSGEVTPDSVRAADPEELRGAGLSGSKLAAILDLAEKVGQGEVALDDAEHASDAELSERLVRIRGVGPWTADMFLLFTLRRPDVWPTGDLGVRQGMARILGWSTAPTPGELELMGTGYRPWRSAAAWYCWRAVELLPPVK